MRPRGGIGLQSLESGDRTGDGVLLAGEVVVHDLQEFAGRLGHGFHVFLDVRVVHTELVRAQGTHAVVGATLCVTLDEVVHGGTTVEHELQHGFQRNHVGERGQRVVFAERVASEVCRPDIGAGFAQTSGLGEGHGGERHLRELRQVEQAFGVAIGHAVGGELLRVIAHEAQDREAELGAGELVGALPHVAGGGGLGTLVQNHALLLDALAGVDEGGARCADQCGAAGDELAVDTAGDFEGHAAVAHLADALDGDFDGVVKLNHAVHVVGPAGNLVVADSHMPCTSGAAKPEMRAPRVEVWIGLKSPEVRAKAVMSCGATTFTRRSRRRGVGAISSCSASPNSGASAGKASE